MSEKEEAGQELLDVRYFAERMLRGLYEQDQKQMQDTLFELAKLAAIYNNIDVVRVYNRMVELWNLGTFELRKREVSDDDARQAAFRVIGEIFGKYRLNGGSYEADEV